MPYEAGTPPQGGDTGGARKKKVAAKLNANQEKTSETSSREIPRFSTNKNATIGFRQTKVVSDSLEGAKALLQQQKQEPQHVVAASRPEAAVGRDMPIDPSRVESVWDEMLKYFKEASMPPLQLNVLGRVNKRFEGSKLMLGMTNPAIQEVPLEAVRVKVLAYFRDAFEHDAIELDKEVIRQEDARHSVEKPLTQEEKIRHLTQKYPLLAKLRQDFGLDLL